MKWKLKCTQKSAHEYLLAILKIWKQHKYYTTGKLINRGSSVQWNGIILLSNKKQQNPDKYNNLDISQVHYAKWKKPESKGYILYDSIYMTLLEGERYRYKNKTNKNFRCQVQGMWGQNRQQKDRRTFLWWCSCFILIVLVVTQLHTCAFLEFYN